jgi:hypothetical protein
MIWIEKAGKIVFEWRFEDSFEVWASLCWTILLKLPSSNLEYSKKKRAVTPQWVQGKFCGKGSSRQSKEQDT